MKQRDLDKVADYLFQTEEWTMYELILFGNLQLLWCGLCHTAWERSEGVKISTKKWSPSTGLNSGLNYLPKHCLEHLAFENASYFEAYVEKIIGKSKLWAEISFIILKVALYQKGQTEKGGSKCKKPCIFLMG